MRLHGTCGEMHALGVACRMPAGHAPALHSASLPDGREMMWSPSMAVAEGDDYCPDYEYEERLPDPVEDGEGFDAYVASCLRRGVEPLTRAEYEAVAR